MYLFILMGIQLYLLCYQKLKKVILDFFPTISREIQIWEYLHHREPFFFFHLLQWYQTEESHKFLHKLLWVLNSYFLILSTLLSRSMFSSLIPTSFFNFILQPRYQFVCVLVIVFIDVDLFGLGRWIFFQIYFFPFSNPDML